MCYETFSLHFIGLDFCNLFKTLFIYTCIDMVRIKLCSWKNTKRRKCKDCRCQKRLIEAGNTTKMKFQKT